MGSPFSTGVDTCLSLPCAGTPCAGTPCAGAIRSRPCRRRPPGGMRSVTGRAYALLMITVGIRAAVGGAGTATSPTGGMAALGTAESTGARGEIAGAGATGSSSVAGGRVVPVGDGGAGNEGPRAVRHGRHQGLQWTSPDRLPPAKGEQQPDHDLDDVSVGGAEHVEIGVHERDVGGVEREGHRPGGGERRGEHRDRPGERRSHDVAEKQHRAEDRDGNAGGAEQVERRSRVRTRGGQPPPTGRGSRSVESECQDLVDAFGVGGARVTQAGECRAARPPSGPSSSQAARGIRGRAPHPIPAGAVLFGSRSASCDRQSGRHRCSSSRATPDRHRSAAARSGRPSGR